MENQEKTLIIMRGLPSAGKSFRSRQLLEEYASKGIEGVIYSTDEYWYKVNYPDKPDEYSFNPRFLAHAHKWNQLRTQRSIDVGCPLIIIDNTNTMASEFCCNYAKYAHFQDYKVRIEEPTSPQWMTVREILKNKKQNKKLLKEWAVKLAEINKESHNVPFFAIEKMMWRWENNLDAEKVIEKCCDSHNG